MLPLLYRICRLPICLVAVVADSVLSQSPLLYKLPPEAQKVIRDASAEWRYRRGELIFQKGDPGEALYIVLSGKVRIFRESLEGRTKVLAYIHPSEVFGEMSLVEERPRSASALAETDTEVLMLFRDTYMNLLKRFPLLGHNLARIIAARLRETNEEVLFLTFEEARSKVAFALLKLLRHRHGEPRDGGWFIPIVHQEIANLAGTSRETATRVVHELRQKKIIETPPGGVLLKDVQALEQVLYGLL